MRYGFLLSRRWITLGVVLVLAAVACGLLSRWQWNRYEQRSADVERIQANYSAEPVSLESVIGRPDPTASYDVLPAEAREWTKVSVTGTYVPGATILIRNRTLDSETGFYVLAPLRVAPGVGEGLSDAASSGGASSNGGPGYIIWINRGWIPTTSDGITPSEVPAEPSHVVTVIGNVRPPEPQTDRSAPAGQAQTMDVMGLSRQAGLVDAAAGGLDQVTYPAFVVAQGEDPTPASAPRRMPAPDLDLGSHLSYTFQWIVFGIVALAAFWILARREREDREALSAERAEGLAGDQVITDGGGVAPDKPTRTSRPPRDPTRRARSLDEEEEDALVEGQRE